MIIKKNVVLYKHRKIDQGNRIQSRNRPRHVLHQLISDQGAMSIQWRKECLLTNGAEKLDIHPG